MTVSAAVFDLERTSIKEGVVGVSFTTVSADSCIQKTYAIIVGEKGRRERSTDPVPALPLLPLASLGPDPPTTPSASPDFQAFYSISITTYDSCTYRDTTQVAESFKADPADLGLQKLQLAPSATRALVNGAIAATACGEPLFCDVESGTGCEPLCTLVEVTFNVAAGCPTRPLVFRTGSSNAFPDGSATRTSAVGTSCQNAFPPEPPYVTIKVDGQPLTGVTTASAYFGNYGTASFSRTLAAVESSVGLQSAVGPLPATVQTSLSTQGTAVAGAPSVSTTFYQSGYLEAFIAYYEDNGCPRTISISAGDSSFRVDSQPNSGGKPLISPVISLAPEPEPARPSAASASSAPSKGAFLNVGVGGNEFCAPYLQFGALYGNTTKDLGFLAFTITPSASRAKVTLVYSTHSVFTYGDGSVERNRFTGRYCTTSFDPTARIGVTINGQPLTNVVRTTGSFGHTLNADCTRVPPTA
ncbi:hypothetical protein HYH03_004510 [Edaphochlamys debaryana]|uniref:Uncharacterized protein n=1 Tax=Edaphochlamys debaryana TaxID=47281 RepID=A0A836C366_9CHLO|nr:hypothetical protein HYH03_004510 [Edaphochlamys debaryana]|eukprot:KAG2497349.1 hypothetical protein HYH03_004510 [Edaphochlamys debaryana]